MIRKRQRINTVRTMREALDHSGIAITGIFGFLSFRGSVKTTQRAVVRDCRIDKVTPIPPL